MTAPARIAPPGYPRLGALRRPRVALFAALCLVSGWLHVWQHHSAHEEHGLGGARAALAHAQALAHEHRAHEHRAPAHEHGEDCAPGEPRRTHDGGHFDSETSDLCQLADNPWVDLPPPPDAARAPWGSRAAPPPSGAAVARPAIVPPIRGPPSA